MDSFTPRSSSYDVNEKEHTSSEIDNSCIFMYQHTDHFVDFFNDERISTDDIPINNDDFLEFESHLYSPDDSYSSIFTDQGLDDILSPANSYLFDEYNHTNTTTSSTTACGGGAADGGGGGSNTTTKKKKRGNVFERLTAQSPCSSPLKRRWSDFGLSDNSDKYQELDYLFGSSSTACSSSSQHLHEETNSRKRRCRSYSTNTTSLIESNEHSSRSSSRTSANSNMRSISRSVLGGLQVTFGGRTESDLKKINTFLSRHKKNKNKNNHRQRSKTCIDLRLLPAASSPSLSSNNNNNNLIKSIQTPTKLIGGDKFLFPSGGSLTVKTISTNIITTDLWNISDSEDLYEL